MPLKMCQSSASCNAEPSTVTFQAGGDRLVNAVWAYEDPYQAAASIKDHLAFYPIASAA
jgi:uncharacterized protein (DUF427 family)